MVMADIVSRWVLCNGVATFVILAKRRKVALMKREQRQRSDGKDTVGRRSPERVFDERLMRPKTTSCVCDWPAGKEDSCKLVYRFREIDATSCEWRKYSGLKVCKFSQD